MILINAKTFRVKRKDQYNVILEQRITRTRKKTGEEYQAWELDGYYGKWVDLIKHLVDSKIDTPKGSNLLEQIPELLKEIRRVEVAILDELKGLEK